MTSPALSIVPGGQALQLRLSGRIVAQDLHLIEAPLAQIVTDLPRVEIDLGEVEALDTAGAWVITGLRRRFEVEGKTVLVSGGDAARTSILETVSGHDIAPDQDEAPPRGVLPLLEGTGRATVATGQDLLKFLDFFGRTLHRMGRSLVKPWRLRPAALFTQMEETGLKAIPIVALMGFLIGIVLAFQGAAQLRQFGAEVFVVDLIAISILRELGVLLTAIIVAGRSGSAFTASVGSMKVQEEIDAMRTLGLDPMEVLVVPRTLALLVMLPILTLIANLAGLVGGALMSWLDLGVSPGMFINRLRENTDIWHLAIGLIKAPFFAFTIGVIACYQAMQVRGSSQSLGARTTASVVQSIFAVILLDALFSIFFAEIGL